MAWGATCVQILDDSWNSTIHIKYHISLHSLSMLESIFSLLRVILDISQLRWSVPQRTIFVVARATIILDFLGMVHVEVYCLATRRKTSTSTHGKGKGGAP